MIPGGEESLFHLKCDSQSDGHGRCCSHHGPVCKTRDKRRTTLLRKWPSLRGSLENCKALGRTTPFKLLHQEIWSNSNMASSSLRLPGRLGLLLSSCLKKLRAIKEFIVCSSPHLIIGPWPSFLRAFTKNSIQLWIFPLPLRDAYEMHTYLLQLESIFPEDLKAIPLKWNHQEREGLVSAERPERPNANLDNCQLTDTADLTEFSLTEPS